MLGRSRHDALAAGDRHGHAAEHRGARRRPRAAGARSRRETEHRHGAAAAGADRGGAGAGGHRGRARSARSASARGPGASRVCASAWPPPRRSPTGWDARSSGSSRAEALRRGVRGRRPRGSRSSCRRARAITTLGPGRAIRCCVPPGGDLAERARRGATAISRGPARRTLLGAGGGRRAAAQALRRPGRGDAGDPRRAARRGHRR